MVPNHTEKCLEIRGQLNTTRTGGLKVYAVEFL
jgi:hypothetical protein